MNWLECLPDRLAQVSATSPWALLLTKATLLLAVAWLVHFSLAWANPRWRTLLWRGVAVGLALLAVWALGLPGLVIRVEAPGPMAAVPVPSLPPMVAEHEPAAFPLASARPAEAPASVEMTAPARETSAVESSAPPFSWPALLLGIWGCGVLLMLVRMATAYRKLAGLLQSSQPVPDEIVAEARRIAAATGCRRLVEVRSSRQYAVPFLYGLRRPTLVLPERMCQPAYRAQLPGIIAHELAHVSARDFGWNAALQAVAIVLWFHPLVWRVGSAHRAACDAICDAVSAAYLGDVQAYCRVLARGGPSHGPDLRRTASHCRAPAKSVCGGSRPSRGGRRGAAGSDFRDTAGGSAAGAGGICGPGIQGCAGLIARGPSRR
jgi:beta-lactamase regulating signal transducer with metallopeptidase domain